MVDDGVLLQYVTRFWKISPNVTFYNSIIYNQTEERQLPINFKVVTMCISHFELPENNWKYFKKFCNPFFCSHNKSCNFMYFNVTLRLIFQNRVTYADDATPICSQLFRAEPILLFFAPNFCFPAIFPTFLS